MNNNLLNIYLKDSLQQTNSIHVDKKLFSKTQFCFIFFFILKFIILAIFK